MRVLVCDDHAVFGESLALVLYRAGYQVVAVTRAPDEAVEALRGSAVDVCVLDLLFSNSPAVAGSAGSSAHTLSRVREMHAVSPATRFVLLSGHLTREVINSARAAGVCGIVNKGCHVAAIVSTIARVHAGEEVITVSDGSRGIRSASPQTDIQRLCGFLTSREREVLSHLVSGADTVMIAKSMGVSLTTARSHIQSVLNKLGTHSRLEAATSAVRHGVVSGETGQWLL